MKTKFNDSPQTTDCSVCRPKCCLTAAGLECIGDGHGGCGWHGCEEAATKKRCRYLLAENGDDAVWLCPKCGGECAHTPLDEVLYDEGVPCECRRRAKLCNSLVQRHGRNRIEAYKEYEYKYCISDNSMRRLMRKKMPPGMKFQRAKYPVGSVVKGTLWPGMYLVVGHGFTGSHGQERGCYGCKITDRIFKRWQWVGPDKTLTPVPLNAQADTRHE